MIATLTRQLGGEQVRLSCEPHRTESGDVPYLTAVPRHPGDLAVQCPHCWWLHALRSANGHVLGLGSEESLRVVQAQTRGTVREACTIEAPTREPMRLLLPRPNATSHGAEGEAVCERCRREVGQLNVSWSIFGLAEDEAVLEFGRCRVYGADGTGGRR